MKAPSVLVASVMAASSLAVSSFGDRKPSDSTSSKSGSPARKEAGPSTPRRSSSEKEKFAPRFDGLRFIETLVTAHR